MLPTSGDAEHDAPSVVRAVARLREIARILDRPVSDFYGPPLPEEPRGAAAGKADPMDGEEE